MGVPKFFRYMSERYPCLSESVREYQIPEFDNLYLDMNGIIHNCSHPDDGNPHFRITEEKIFADVFHYIEILFSMINPQKVFFMAIDGVAPRAKMNQQRGRRFKTAKDAEKQEKEALKRGEELPKVPRFDSNCITPGTEFMARLHEQLKYFVVKKVSQDPLWQRCEIILSGHETPGEGEHKIMDFIRYKRSQPDYDPNTRHCLYGLDADLIMLGLCTHDKNFSLLREEVKFGKKNTKKNSMPEEIQFFLLHLSLMREYLELEFAQLKETLTKFEFDIEKIIDDWVLMVFLVGNDFIPHLPDLHINKGALPVLYKVYMDVLPQLDGYINECGTLNLKRFEVFLKKLGERDMENFEVVREDLLYMEAKTGRKCQPFAKNNTQLRDLESWKPDPDEENLRPEMLSPLEEKVKTKDLDLSALIAATEKEFMDDEDDISGMSDEDDEEEFESYKRSYYMNKLEYDKVTPEVMKSQAEGYVRAIQWNLHYYYNGVCSWSWYYPHHYAPYISDIKCFQNLKLEYELGKPFMPYEQLLAVLPSGSKNLLPKCYQNLMTDDKSPIKRYYPEQFDTDLNGKQQEWEAIVLVPFIDENVLLEAMKNCEDGLNQEERERNRHGPMLVYTYSEESYGVYKAPMYFPAVTNNHAKVKEMSIEELRVPIEKLVKGAHPKASSVYCSGFPTFRHLQYRGELRKAKVKVFEQASRGENMIIHIIPSLKAPDAMPLDLLGKNVYVGWPYLTEAKVVAVYNDKNKYVHVGEGVDPVLEPSLSVYNTDIKLVEEHYNTRLGITFGEVSVMVKVQTLIGQKYLFSPNGRVSLEKTFCKNTSNYPLQLIVENVKVIDLSCPVIYTLNEAFPVDSKCFALTKNEYYGSKGIVKRDERADEGKVCVCVTVIEEPDFSKIKASENIAQKYRKSYHATAQLNMSNNVFSRLTGCVLFCARNKEGGLKNVNLGLELKNNKKNLETPGYTKKIDGMWYYTDAVIDLVAEYAKKFPEVVNNLYRNQQQNLSSVEEIFPDDSESKLKEVQAWLKSQHFNQVEKRPCNSTVLDKEVVEEIERLIDNYNPANTKRVVLYCKPYLLYKPELQFGNLIPDPGVKVELFDRVVHIKNNHTVPLGLKGTVIGIHKGTSDDPREHTFDILFDAKFEGGKEFNCSNGRGYRLPLKSFINISYGIRMYRTSTSVEKKTEDVHKKYANYNANVQNRGFYNIPNSNSAFVKFGSKPFPNSAQASYNAVPPFMLNGDPIYKSYTQRQGNAYNNQFVPRSGGPPVENFDYINPFQKTYSPSEFFKNPMMSSLQPTEQKSTKTEPSAAYKGNDNKNESAEKKVAIDKKKDFMPSFMKTPESEIDKTADVLKKMLKIGMSPEKKEKAPHHQQHKKKVVQQHLPLKKEPAQLPVKPLSRVNSSQLFSVQLLSYYQSQGLGLPRYQYVETEQGCVQAQIQLPNRQIIIGQNASNREEASEFVAKQALQQLLKPNEKKEESLRKIPAPPKQWFNQDQKKKAEPILRNTENKEKDSKGKTAWDGMIPLQVVRKEKASSSNSNSHQTVGNSRRNNNQNIVPNDNPAKHSSENCPSNEKKHHKPKRERKMRIAANFAMNQ